MIILSFKWLLINIEIIGFITALIYLYFSIKQKIWLWLFGIISSGLYVYVFFVSKFYADMALMLFYVGISIYGWIYWIIMGKQKESGKSEFPVTRTPSKTVLYLILVTFILFIGIGLFLDNVTDSPVPYWDSFTTSASITATWMLARKYIEHWLIWIIVDAVSMGLYISKDLYFTTILYCVYTIMALVGFIRWRNDMRESDKISPV